MIRIQTFSIQKWSKSALFIKYMRNLMHIMKILSNKHMIAEIFLEIESGKIHYNIIQQQANQENFKRMYCYPVSTIPDLTNNFMLYFMPNNYGLYLHDGNNIFVPQTNYIMPNYTAQIPQTLETTFLFEKTHGLISLNTQAESPEKTIQQKKGDKTSQPIYKTTYKKCQKLGIQEIKLEFRTQWKNQNRNIVPNLVNQMMSFLQKKNKSQKLIEKLFAKFSHESSWTPNKFYLYMKKIKDSISHYVNESVIQYFFQTHEPKCQIYQENQQQFYMKVCRIAVVHFLKSDAIIISLTSTRMSQAKRKTHLIARQALLNKFLQLARSRSS